MRSDSSRATDKHGCLESSDSAKDIGES
jgi:hypothetical protein